MNYPDKKIESLIEGVWTGKITPEKLPVDLYNAISSYLEKGLFKGFGGDLTDFSGSKLELLKELRENVYLFSGAKTYQTVSAISLVKDDEQVLSFRDFKEFAIKEYDLYNKTWAAAEYDTAIANSQNAAAWAKFEEDADILPLLRYSAVMDANTSEICAPLDGVVLPVNDPFWDKFAPTNHYNCRCLLEQLDEGEKTSKEKADKLAETVGSEMNDGFKQNVGKSKDLFGKDHPYFDVPAKDKDLAKENFGLPLPEDI